MAQIDGVTVRRECAQSGDLSAVLSTVFVMTREWKRDPGSGFCCDCEEEGVPMVMESN